MLGLRFGEAAPWLKTSTHMKHAGTFAVHFPFIIVGNLPSNTQMKANADGADGPPFHDNLTFIRSFVIVGYALVLISVKYGLTGLLTFGVIIFPHPFTVSVEDYLVKRVLGWRGGMGVTKWALPFVELLQLSTKCHWAFWIVHQRADIFDLTNLRIGSTIILADSIVSFLWITGVFCYFNFIRMSRTPYRYEPVHQPPCTTETEPTFLLQSPRSPGASKSSISALAKAFERQRHQGLDARRGLSVHVIDGHFNGEGTGDNVQAAPTKPPFTHVRRQPSLSSGASSTLPHFHPHQIAWDSQRSGLLFRLGIFIFCCSAIGVLDNGVQMLGCDEPWQLLPLKGLLAWHSAISITVIASLVIVVRQISITRGLGRSLARVYLLVLYILGTCLPLWQLIAAKAPSLWMVARVLALVTYSSFIMFWDGLLFKGEMETRNFQWMYSLIVNK